MSNTKIYEKKQLLPALANWEIFAFEKLIRIMF